MSEDIYATPDLSKKVRFQTGEKADGNADVYEIPDNVNIYDNYLPPQGSKPLELQDSTTEDPQKAISVNVPSGGRNLLRPAAMFLLLLCLLFLAGVVVLVVLLIQDKGHNADLTRARDELQTSYGEMKSLNANLTQKTNQLEKEIYHLKVIESNLTTAIDELKQQQESSCCPDNWIRFGTSCYLISNSEKNWNESKSFCEEQNAQLVIISSEQEQNFISSFHRVFWIGLSNEAGTKVWKWVNGSVTVQTYWATDQPDYFEDSEHCAHIQYFSLYSWNDLNCICQEYFLCEKILE
ncbi:C-type lectin domain family 6 member A-like isoform X2 [Hippoglossus hippoglossus]|uniref:C-type lectin domain family 6 member A-like isoform X2 n=1 Tax=Hippoglossus hippoglossus TaxID=8267 RepID=UPI00148DAC70|nr:C-type lectin domain family 6 member A-like isoform X2 [Hippoglossus hippoglossus]